ncbi:unnamed protein product [Coffea canephora]|uniref:Aspartate/glutamate/uridylate kinase domain-containing protein n=1 Tax=Coffea canephora TaxID=49390 RepID=A0A068UWC2_COFCA|nr:unnamed protein product [Coffea canephora]
MDDLSGMGATAVGLSGMDDLSGMGATAVGLSGMDDLSGMGATAVGLSGMDDLSGMGATAVGLSGMDDLSGMGATAVGLSGMDDLSGMGATAVGLSGMDDLSGMGATAVGLSGMDDLSGMGATAAGLSGMDDHLLTARPPSPNSGLLGFVGDIATGEPAVLRPLIDNGYIPVVASVAADKTGRLYIINADTVAGELAAALAAEKLILLTDVAGILEERDDPGSLMKEVDIEGARRMMNDEKIAGGMFQKVDCCVRSVAQGVRVASIIDGRVQHSLLLEFLTGGGAGTMITG